ncbi:MAG TPA: hypothetical protein VL490_01180 [Mucilaginibacter sp.]|jgi:hypothetical protein|nr:hypothetical protein [Mucilaginibacter sp.]
MPVKKNIILITPGQPALNPRLVKEADALADAGYNVTVFYAYWNSWGYTFSKNLLLKKKWKAICVGGNPFDKRITYFISRIVYKIARFIVKKLGPINYFAELSASRSSFFLLRTIKKHKADLYIAHYLGALAPAIKAAKTHHAKWGFDAEDFHRQEITDDSNSFNFKLAKYLEDKYLDKVDYVTVSSPQIADTYKKIYPAIIPVTILNVFPINDDILEPRCNTTGPVKLFWVSQTIGSNRGIDVLINALQLLNDMHFELHLLGYVTAEDKHLFVQAMHLATGSSIHFHEPILPDGLIAFASQFDIGLALEPGFCLNNDLALSNKIFIYLQAGLAIIASNTTAQQGFIKENPDVGKIYTQKDIHALADILWTYHTNRELLSKTCKASLMLRQRLNWENESIKFLSLINKTLNKIEP